MEDHSTQLAEMSGNYTVRNAKYMSLARSHCWALQTTVKHQLRQSEKGQGYRSSILVLVFAYSQTPWHSVTLAFRRQI